MNHKIDPKLDLVLEKKTDVAPEQIWKALTEPAHLKAWFCPRPWKTVEAELDVRPGGVMRTVMQSPEGQNMPEGVGCYLEVVKNQKLVWTSALLPGYRPQKASTNPHEFPFTAVILIEADGKGSKYTAIAIHRDEESKNTHAAMGFQDGWGMAFDQMVEHIKKSM